MDKLIAEFMVFKTNIKNEIDRLNLMFSLDSDPEIDTWSLDIEDVDHVLRVASISKTPNDVQSIVRKLGYECAELD
jgi:hypothetical protein